MANPQPTEFTRISNELLDALCSVRIPGEAVQILLFIFRKTYGFHKKNDNIPLSQFSESTGLKRPNVSRAIRKLEEMNLILVNRNNKTSNYSIQKNYDNWIIPKKKNTTKITLAGIKKDNSKIVHLLVSKKIRPGIKKDTNKGIKKDTLKRKKDTLSKESKEDLTFFIKNLFFTFTKIKNPQYDFHIKPILYFFEIIPESLNVISVKKIINIVFSKLKPGINIRIDFLCSNIQNNITIEIENILQKRKSSVFKQAKQDRAKEKKINFISEKEKEISLIQKYKNFYFSHENLFSIYEKSNLVNYFRKNLLLQAGSIIEPKMEVTK